MPSLEMFLDKRMMHVPIEIVDEYFSKRSRYPTLAIFGG